MATIPPRKIYGRAVGLRKILFVDSGLAANLCGLTEARLRRTDSLVGPLMTGLLLTVTMA